MNQRILVALSMTVFCAKVFPAPAPEYISIVANSSLEKIFTECHPELAMLQAYDELPFPEASEQVAHRALASIRVTPIIFPFNREIFAPNRYAIHSIPCADDASDLCHYLSVMPTLGLPQYRVYGPLNFSCMPIPSE